MISRYLLKPPFVLTLISAIAISLIFIVGNHFVLPGLTQVSYDLVIRNGRVMDPETNFDSIRNVGIKDGVIAAITDSDISGEKVIDATGLVVAPGFIDAHAHGQDPFAAKLSLRDGVTTGMDLELGAAFVGDWYDRKQAEGAQRNYGATSALPLYRILIHDPEVTIDEPVDFTNMSQYITASAQDGIPGWAVSRSTLEQMNEIMQLVDEDLHQGALGVAVPAAYMAKGLTSYEQFEAQRTAARYGRLSTSHTRFHLSSETPTEATLGVDEILVNAMLLKAPLLIHHDNDYGWWEVEEKLKIARDDGHNVWGEYFPYKSGSTVIGADFLRPEIWEEAYGNKYEETMYDPLSGEFIDRATYDQLVAEDPAHTIILFFPWREPWLKHWLTIPEMTLGSDSMGGDGVDGQHLPWDADYTEFAGHPRTAGNYAKTLRLGRENGVPLMFTLAQTSYWSAKHLGDAGIEAMRQRGRLQEGKIADITVFDPLSATDNSTYEVGENGLPSTGIPYVIVNGTVVVQDSEVLPVKPGQPIRYPVERESRWQPLGVDEWLGEYTINIPTLPEVDDAGLDEVL